MTEFIPSEKGQSIRFPSTANLYIDSRDRDLTLFPNADNFTINKNANILTGFFTRLAVQEVVLQYDVPNISVGNGNNTFTATVGATTATITLNDGYYTVEQALDTIVLLLNATALNDFSISVIAGGIVYLANTSAYTITPTTLSTQLSIVNGGTATTTKQIVSPDLLSNKYLDIVCDSLTYNQELKDSSTSEFEYTTLYRWYLAWDNEPANDDYGFPIYQGYKPFIQRRSIAFPKQVKWSNTQPIGQLVFRVYDENGQPLDPTYTAFEFSLNLLVSEV
jgi:hypothetical protein